MPFSLRPSEAEEGGSFIPTGTSLEVIDSGYAMWDYNGRFEANVAMRQVLRDLNDNTEYTQYWGIGKMERYGPLIDDPNADVPALTKQCNAYEYIEAAVKAGFPENKIDGAHSFIGTVFEFTAKPGKERDFKDEGKKTTKGILVPGKVVKLPGEKAKATTAKATVSTPVSKPVAPKAAPAANGAVSDEEKAGLTELVMFVAGKEGDEFEKAKLGAAVFAKDGPLSGSAHKDAVGKIVFGPKLAELLPEIGYQLAGTKVKAA